MSFPAKPKWVPDLRHKRPPFCLYLNEPPLLYLFLSLLCLTWLCMETRRSGRKRQREVKDRINSSIGQDLAFWKPFRSKWRKWFCYKPPKAAWCSIRFERSEEQKDLWPDRRCPLSLESLGELTRLIPSFGCNPIKKTRALFSSIPTLELAKKIFIHPSSREISGSQRSTAFLFPIFEQPLEASQFNLVLMNTDFQGLWDHKPVFVFSQANQSIGIQRIFL